MSVLNQIRRNKTTGIGIHLSDSTNQCCGSRILIFAHPGSRISDPGSRIPDLGSRISDPGSRIPDLSSRIQKQQQKRGVKKIYCHTFFLATNFTKLTIIY
jgi:hypothetical protein